MTKLRLTEAKVPKVTEIANFELGLEPMLADSKGHVTLLQDKLFFISLRWNYILYFFVIELMIIIYKTEAEIHYLIRNWLYSNFSFRLGTKD